MKTFQQICSYVCDQVCPINNSGPWEPTSPRMDLSVTHYRDFLLWTWAEWTLPVLPGWRSLFEWGAGPLQPLQCCKRTLWWRSKQSKFNFQLGYKPFLLHHLRNTNKGYKVTIKCSGILVGPLAEIFSHSPLRTYRTVVPAIWNSPGSSIFQSLLMDLLLESFKAATNQTPRNEMEICNYNTGYRAFVSRYLKHKMQKSCNGCEFKRINPPTFRWPIVMFLTWIYSVLQNTFSWWSYLEELT